MIAISVPLLAAKLLDLREEHGYSQQFVAEYLNMSREGYCNYERAAREPGLDTLLKLCTLYQIEIDELINSTIVFSSSNDQKIYTNKETQSRSNSYVEKNILHLLKLFSGKNVSFDFTNLTKEDISFLAEYKTLEKQDQKELQEFLHFKQYCKKNKAPAYTQQKAET